MTVETARERLIQTAISLFNQHGFHATGVDRIVEVARVAKKTLYAHFPSKRDLILAALERKEHVFKTQFLPAVTEAGQTPHDRLIALFEMAKNWFAAPDFYGCLFINAAVEFSNPDDDIRRCVQTFKQMLRGFVREQAVAGGASDPDTLADQISLLFEGATTVAQVTGRPDAATTARGIAEKLIAEQFR